MLKEEKKKSQFFSLLKQLKEGASLAPIRMTFK